MKPLPATPQIQRTEPQPILTSILPPAPASPTNYGTELLTRASRRHLLSTSAPPTQTPVPATDDDLPPLVYNSKGEVVLPVKAIPSSAFPQLLVSSRPSSHYYIQLFNLFSTTYDVVQAAFALYGSSKDKFEACYLFFMQELISLESNAMLQRRRGPVAHCSTNYSRIL